MSAKSKSKSDQQPPGPRRLLTYPEWAAENRVSIDTVRRKVQRGELTVKRVSPGRVFIVEASA
jgi:predicted site-specific integrase-resolvase